MKLIITVAQRILICINNEYNYNMKIAKKIDVTLGSAAKSTKALIEDGFMETELIGRKNILTLTEKGRLAKDLLMGLKKLE